MIFLNKLLYYKRFDYLWHDKVLFGYNGVAYNSIPTNTKDWAKFTCLPIPVEIFE